MKKLTDEEIERQLFSALATPPDEGLTMDFPVQLRRNLQKRLDRADRLRFYGLWVGIFLLVMGGLFFGLQLMDEAFHTTVIRSVTEHKWIFIIGFPVLFLIQYLDHRSIKKRQLNKYQAAVDSCNIS